MRERHISVSAPQNGSSGKNFVISTAIPRRRDSRNAEQYHKSFLFASRLRGCGNVTGAASRRRDPPLHRGCDAHGVHDRSNRRGRDDCDVCVHSNHHEIR